MGRWPSVVGSGRALRDGALELMDTEGDNKSRELSCMEHYTQHIPSIFSLNYSQDP